MSAMLVLVASYPKSGNTWVRLVFEKLRRGPDWRFSINDMATGYYGLSRRLLFDSVSPANAADLLLPEIENMLPKVLRHVAAESFSDLILKVHDDARQTEDGDWLYPPDSTRAVIYLVRHPFDVAVSCANHLGMTIEEAVKLMGDDRILSHFERSLPLSLPQHVGSWSTNISTWLDAKPYNVTLARYEDLYANPHIEFVRLANAAGIAATDDDVARAIELSRFDSLQQQEKEQGFRERPPTSTNFFRVGRPRSWEGTLAREFQDQLSKQHAAVMERLGYAPNGDTLPLPPS